jgi:hypothetical protein
MTDLILFTHQPHSKGIVGGCCLQQDHYMLAQRFRERFCATWWVTIGGPGRDNGQRPYFLSTILLFLTLHVISYTHYIEFEGLFSGRMTLSRENDTLKSGENRMVQPRSLNCFIIVDISFRCKPNYGPSSLHVVGDWLSVVLCYPLSLSTSSGWQRRILHG